jgi:hypothetical protein
MKAQITLNLLICACLSITGLLSLNIKAQTNNISIPTNLPQTTNTPILIGQIDAEAMLTIENSRRFAVDIVLPVDNAAVKLVDANGVTIISSDDPGVEVILGDQLGSSEPLPGAIYAFSPMDTPSALPLKVIATFPAATEKTVMVTTVFVESKYQSGIALSAEQYFVGDAVSLGFLLLSDGSPITGASVTLELSQQAGGLSTSLVASDNGLNGDAIANDGIYSIEQTFLSAGTFVVKGTANFTEGNETVSTSAMASFSIIRPVVIVEELTTSLIVNTADACIDGINMTANVDAVEQGEYIFYAGLLNSVQALQDKRKAVTLTQGSASVVLSYTRDDLLELYGPQLVDIVFASLGILSFGDDLVAAGAAKAPETLSVNQPLCSDPVVIGNLISVTPVLSNGSVAQLEFTIGVNVSISGSYQVSFKIVDSVGSNVVLLGERRTLNVGLNELTFSVNNSEFMSADGPYQVLSGLVLGPAGSANKGSLGSGGEFNRWQFVAIKDGDLNNDGAITVADRNILLQYRNQPAAVPGDRRDLNADGKIDLKDVRALSRLPK